MPTAGKIVTLGSGKRGVLASGKAGVYKSGGTCTECCAGGCPWEDANYIRMQVSLYVYPVRLYSGYFWFVQDSFDEGTQEWLYVPISNADELFGCVYGCDIYEWLGDASNPPTNNCELEDVPAVDTCTDMLSCVCPDDNTHWRHVPGMQIFVKRNTSTKVQVRIVGQFWYDYCVDFASGGDITDFAAPILDSDSEGTITSQAGCGANPEVCNATFDWCCNASVIAYGDAPLYWWHYGWHGGVLGYECRETIVQRLIDTAHLTFLKYTP
jgi:hypothetical protein